MVNCGITENEPCNLPASVHGRKRQKVHLDFNLKLSGDILVFCESNTKAEIQKTIRSHLNRQLVIIRLDYKEFLWSGSSEAIKSEEF